MANRVREMGGASPAENYNPNNPKSIDTRIPKISPYLLDYKINPKAFINAHNFPNLDALVEEVKRIDNDNKAYESMRNEPIFLDNFNPKVFYEKKILDFFDNIFSQSPNLAFRRGEGLILYGYRNSIAKINNYDKYESLGTDALNIARFYDRIHKSTQRFRRKLKFWRTKN